MKHLLTKIKALFNSLFLAHVHPWWHDPIEELIRTIFEWLRNTVLCAVILGIGVWLRINSSRALFYQKFPPELFYIISGVFLGLNLVYFDMKLRKLKFPRIVWFLLMLIFFALSFFLYFMLVIAR
jgi:hypothetical protein